MIRGSGPVPMPRRRALLTLAATAAGGCGGGSPAGGTGGKVDCRSTPDGGASPTYCLVVSVIVRSAGARLLAVGQAQLTNIDDNTAVIVARDAGGYHALSGICTHYCCLVSLCADLTCATPTTNPGECGTTAMVAADPAGQGILCACHGSRFRLDDGEVLLGPATHPLPSFALSFDGDDALVDTTRPVDAAKRI